MNFYLSLILGLIAAAPAACSTENVGSPDGWDIVDTASNDETAGESAPDVVWDSPEFDGEARDCVQDIDIVFVIDVSTSMSFVLEALSAGIKDVWDYALTFSSDAGYSPRFGLVVFVDDVLVTLGGSAYATANDLQSEFNTWRAFTSTEREPGGGAGTNTDCPENAIDALYAGATMPLWRDNALHIIIFATDDTFKERPGTLGSAGLVVQHTYNDVLGEVLAREIRVSAFAAHTGVCWDRNNGEPGFFTGYGGKPSLPEATGSSAYDIQQVASGAISLKEAIKNILLTEYCTPFII